jgi:hypothetical protein
MQEFVVPKSIPKIFPIFLNSCVLDPAFCVPGWRKNIKTNREESYIKMANLSEVGIVTIRLKWWRFRAK